MTTTRPMNLLDFAEYELYFDEPVAEEVQTLLQSAAANYGDGNAEPYLLRAFFLAPHSLSVVVALYRFFYYQHRLEDALVAAGHALRASGERLRMPEDWREVEEFHLANAASRSMGLLRFYLLALKGMAYLKLRLGETQQGIALLSKIRQMDLKDQLGAAALLEAIEPTLNDANPSVGHSVPVDR